VLYNIPLHVVRDLVDSSGNLIAVQPVPYTAVTGTWLSDDAGAAGSNLSFAQATDANGNYYVNNGRVNSNWYTTILWNPPCGDITNDWTYIYINPIVGIPWICTVIVNEEGDNASTHFVLPSAIPAALTSYGNFSTANGYPGLRVYVGGTRPSLVSTVSASSVVTGSSATFPFPTQSNGAPLAEGFYSLVNTNGSASWVDSSYLAVGGNTTLSSAFGVDAGDTSTTVRACIVNPNTGVETCKTVGPSYGVSPIFTQYYSNQVTYRSATLPVGAYPVAVKLYGSYTSVNNNGLTTIWETYPPTAVVVSSGSN